MILGTPQLLVCYNFSWWLIFCFVNPPRLLEGVRSLITTRGEATCVSAKKEAQQRDREGPKKISLSRERALATMPPPLLERSRPMMLTRVWTQFPALP